MSDKPSQAGNPFGANSQAPPDPNTDESDLLDAEAEKRPHPLDEDDYAPPTRSLFSLRNAIAVALTFFTSTILALSIGLPNSVGAMVGVWVATAVLFGPLWYALAHQNYAARFERTDDKRPEDDETDAAADAVVAQPVEDQEAAPIMATNAVTEAAPSPSPTPFAAQSTPSPEPLPSFYQPIQRRELESRSDRLSATGYGVVVVFGVFVGVLVVGSPFLAAVIVRVFG